MGTQSCGGLLAIYEHCAVDEGALWFFDPTTHALVESLYGYNDSVSCTGSADGVDHLASTQAASCFADFAWYGAVDSTSGWVFQDACPSPSPAGPDGSSDASSE